MKKRELVFFQGGIQNFKKRYCLTSYKCQRKEQLINEEDYKDELIFLKNKLIEYLKENIFNADETGLFLRCLPDKTIFKKPKKNSLKQMQRISVLLYTNVTRSIKLKPLIIHSCSKPRCFKKWDPNLLVSYYHNKNAWVIGSIFKE